MITDLKAMRDVVIEEIYNNMHKNNQIFFLSADLGSPALDKLKEDFKERFINVGIAEQNLINVSAGLALEGFIVYAYGINSFLTMRAYEQIRVNLCLLSQLKKINVNLIGVGAGLSYDISGPTHQCLEDITIMRALPNMTVFSPSDSLTAKEFVNYSIKMCGVKYLRLDAKLLPQIYGDKEKIKINEGMKEIKKGKKLCLVSTGIMTHKAINVSKKLSEEGTGVGIIDIYLLKPFNEKLFLKLLKNYKYIITLEEGFVGKGGMDSIILDLINRNKVDIKMINMGFCDNYSFIIGDRNYLHKIYNIDEQNIRNNILVMLGKKL